MTTNERVPRVIGYELLRRVAQAEIPDYVINPRTERGVLGALGERYLIPPGVDVFELGLIDSAGKFELLPIDANDKPLWDEVISLVVSREQAGQQRRRLLRSYRVLHDMIVEGNELEASITEWSARGATHPIFGMLRLEATNVWKEMRRGSEPLSEVELDVLHAHVALRVAERIGAHLR